MSAGDGSPHVIVVGGGFAGLGCARKLSQHDDVRVTLLDRNNYHQFQPLLYQVATSQLGSSNIAMSLRKIFRNHPNVHVKMAEVASIDPAARTVTATDGETWAGDAIVLAAGSQPNFFGTPGADRNSFPLYSLNDAQRLRSRIIGVFEAADREPSLVDRGALNFVVVGGGPTGVETAGALADMIDRTMTVEYRDLAVTAARIHIVDLGHTLLGPFSERAHEYVEKVLQRKGVELHLGTKVTEVAPGHVTLGDGIEIADAVRGVGRRHHGSFGGLRGRRGAGTWRPHRRGARADREGLSPPLCGRRRCQHHGPGRRGAPATRFGRAPERGMGRKEPPRRLRRQAQHSPSTTRTRASWR